MRQASNRVVSVWRLVHYYLWVWEKAFHNVHRYIVPFYWLFRVPAIKALYSRRGTKDVSDYLEKVAFNDPVTGWNARWAGINAGGLLVLLEFGVFNCVEAILDRNLLQYVWSDAASRVLSCILFLLPAGLFNYYVLFRNDRYLQDFEKYEQMPKQKRRRYGWLCFLIVLGILGFIVGSFALVIWVKPGL